jgi:hypothetical protein
MQLRNWNQIQINLTAGNIQSKKQPCSSSKSAIREEYNPLVRSIPAATNATPQQTKLVIQRLSVLDSGRADPSKGE